MCHGVGCKLRLVTEKAVSLLLHGRFSRASDLDKAFSTALGGLVLADCSTVCWVALFLLCIIYPNLRILEELPALLALLALSFSEKGGEEDIMFCPLSIVGHISKPLSLPLEERMLSKVVVHRHSVTVLRN